MIFAIIRSYIGSFGRALMDFYIANSFPINAIILLYALLVFISQRNYLYVIQRIFIALDLVVDGKKGQLTRKISLADHKKISWDDLRKQVWFPLIAVPGKWTLRICTTDFLQAEFSLDKLNSFIDKGREERK